jgi:hypothetical protein
LSSAQHSESQARASLAQEVEHRPVSLPSIALQA